jgi:DNA-binding CsgD family transcriptional regulator/tetratricopeptide (TPR) repeat protein
MPGRLVSPTLIGRDAELESLAAALDRAEEGRPVHVLLAGEAGVGKSRLVAEASRHAAGRGFRVLAGGCADIGDGGIPYGPLVEVLRAVQRELSEDDLGPVLGPARGDLARLLPALGPAPLVPSPTESVQPRLLDALLGVLTRLAAEQPLLLIVEDLHWADPATRDAIGFLVRQLRSDRVLLILTFRADELHRRHPLLPWLVELERSGRVERIPLARLTRERTRDLLAALLEHEPDPESVAAIHHRSDGNPFFIEELAGMGGGAASGSMPATLRDVLLARIVALPETSQTVVRIAAVAGRRVDHDLLAEVAGLPEAVLIEALRGAVGSHVLVTASLADTSAGDYAFRHALLQEAAYDDLLPGERGRLHRSYAAALAALPVPAGAAEAGHWAELAFHWSAARDEHLAFVASVRATAAATGAYAFADAQRHGERALELWHTVEGADGLAGMDRAAMLDRVAQAAWLASDSRRAVALRREAVAELRDADPVLLGIAQERLGRALWYHGDTQAALAAHESAIALIPEDPPTPELARVLAGYGQIVMLLDRWAEATDILERAVDLARLTGARQAEGHARNSLGLCLAAGGRSAEGYASLEAALAIATELASPDDIGRAYVNLGEAKRYAGDPAGALEVVGRGVVAAHRVGLDRTYGFFIRANGIESAFELDAWEEADRLAEENERHRNDGRVHRAYHLARMAQLLVARGDAQTPDCLGELRRVLEGFTVEAQYHAPFRTAEAEDALWSGDPERALAIVAHARDELGPPGTRWYDLRLARVAVRAAAEAAELARARRDAGAEALAVSAGEASLAELGAVLEVARSSLGGLALDEVESEAGLAVAEGCRLRGVADPEAWRSAMARFAGRGNVYVAAYCGLRVAEAELTGGDRGRAAAALRDAHAAATHLGAVPLLAELVRLAARARLDVVPRQAAPSEVAPARPADPFGLTPREREVLPLVVAGRTNRQIAEELFISENTAGVHVSNILGKLGASSRTEAAGIAARLGLG